MDDGQAKCACAGQLSADDPSASVVVVIGGVPRDIDLCIAPIVRALNEGGVATVASCCGHGRMDGTIVLADGRELVIA